MFNIRKTRYTPHTKLELRKLILDDDIELKDIDTSHITDMSHLFEPVLETSEQARFFFDGIETWDVSNVTDMSYMFCFAKNFNQDISNWNVSKVKNMRGMFQFATSFNQDLSKWDVSNVENMSSMFYDAAAFNQNLDLWQIDNVKTMRFMFMYARYFEHKPCWNYKKEVDQVGMFYGTPIVYVDPDLNVGVDSKLEQMASLEHLQSQLDLPEIDDEIKKFANKFLGRSDTRELKEEVIPKALAPSKAPTTQSSDTKVQVSNLERIEKLFSDGLLLEDEYEVLLNYIKSKK